MGYDPTGTWDWNKFWNVLFSIGTTIVAGFVVVGGIVATVASMGALTPLAAFGLSILGSALITAGTAMISNVQFQIQANGWGNVDLGQTWTVGGIGLITGAITGAISFGIGYAFKGIGETFGLLLGNTKIGGLLVSKVFSTQLLTGVFGTIGSVAGGLLGTFMGDYFAKKFHNSQYTQYDAKDSFQSVLVDWILNISLSFFK